MLGSHTDIYEAHIRAYTRCEYARMRGSNKEKVNSSAFSYSHGILLVRHSGDTTPNFSLFIAYAKREISFRKMGLLFK
jgi:hypothetical protein